MPNNFILSNGRGPLQIAAGSRYLTDGGGKPVFLQGDAAWSLIVQLTKSEMDTYLSDRASRGFNLIIVELIEHFFSTNAPNNISNVAPFTGANFTTPNEPYFQRADYAIKLAWKYGITVLLAPLYLGFGGTEEGWDTEIGAASVGDMQSWASYVGGRYKDFDNIIWVIGGDADPTSLYTKVDAFATQLAATDTRHLITAHNQGTTQGITPFTGETWFTLNDIYALDTGVPSLAVDGRATSPTIPFFHIEGYYENENSMTATKLRSQMYWAILGGACGHVFGNSPIWKFAYNGGDWPAALDDEGSVSMMYAGQLFRSKNWHLLVPDSSHTLLTVGYGTLGNADYAGAALVADGSLGIIYMPSNRTMTVDMSKFLGTVTCRWYDPNNGTYTADAASPLANSGTHNFSRATANAGGAADWVLVLST